MGMIYTPPSPWPENELNFGWFSVISSFFKLNFSFAMKEMI